MPNNVSFKFKNEEIKKEDDPKKKKELNKK